MQSKAFVFFLFIFYQASQAQTIDQIINRKEVQRIESFLSSDKMEGRKTFSPAINRAAAFISDEFKSIGLKTFKDANNFRQPFEMVSVKTISASGFINKQRVNEKNIVAVTSHSKLDISKNSGFEIARIRTGDRLRSKAQAFAGSKKNYLVLVSSAFSEKFNDLAELQSQFFKSDKSVVFILTDEEPAAYNLVLDNKITVLQPANIVGVLPGKSKKNEYVIFSAHYDHIGIGTDVAGDSIFNGANDDAAGTTAVIMLAKYFKSLGSQERTLVFVAFTAEEIGGFGSQFFSRQLDPLSVAAMLNIEMIGTDSKWGNNSAYITGYEKTDLGKILEKNLAGTGFKFYPDPYPEQDLFYRSDNATLAKLGVPAHTISTSKMDAEKFYHTVDDEIETLDMDNMAMIIKAIALSAGTIVKGQDTPSRLKAQLLK